MAVSITELLHRASAGDVDAENAVIEQVFPDLHAMARRYFRFERPQHTLQPTALVNEVYLRLMGDAGLEWKDRAHFFAVASRVMRQVLIDHARRVGAQKRGSQARRVVLDEEIVITEDRCVELLRLDEALKALELLNPRLVQVVVGRYFGDMTIDEIAEVLGTSSRTVKRDWEFARAWLQDWLSQ